MKIRIGKAVAKAARISAKIACNSTSCIGFYQPITPKQLKRFKKHVNK